jgi:RHH-type proline utilization regulon transcriptional repressor/proline dehydrogenase/delta 1-pyrroline-5-carboxylate dehydrogenase
MTLQPGIADRRLPSPYRPQADVLEALRAGLRDTGGIAADWSAVQTLAAPWVLGVRGQPAPLWAVESLLQEFPLNSQEGRALMRLAEALLRVPDVETAAALAADQLGRAAQVPHQSHGHPALGAFASRAIDLAQRMLPADGSEPGLLQRLGSQAVVAAAVRGVQLLGRQFVFGRDIRQALDHARGARKSDPAARFSFDMLGEGARAAADAQRYFDAYAGAIDALAAAAQGPSLPTRCDGISIKLSALFARYEDGQRARVLAELVPRAWQLVDRAARAGINLTIDAEESERLELSLDVFEAVLARAAQAHPQWAGFGLAIQAYQTRALETVACVLQLARAARMRLMVRLVKGAYWDAEVKRAQVLGMPDYPVFVDKAGTDLSYLACAKALLAAPDCVFPQFATHNAGTIAAVALLAHQAAGADAPPAFEWQRLHGMGEAVYGQLAADRRDGAAALARQAGVRVYAPVGEHRDLLAYLVRRLLENGANASFVHQLGDAAVPVDALLASPWLAADGSAALPLPPRLYGPQRANALGADHHDRVERAALEAAAHAAQAAPREAAAPPEVDAAMRRLAAAASGWRQAPLEQRRAVLLRAADLLETRFTATCGLLMDEGRKTVADAVAEVREAIDACRYYAQQAALHLGTQLLPGPTGERNELRLLGRGVFVCIAPWNFPLAIFGAQVVAALVAGNAVAAKPASQTPRIAAAFTGLLAEAGLPEGVLACFPGGAEVGAALVAHPLCAGVAFTGSTRTARRIQRTLAEDLPDGRERAIVPLIAETGGLNAMVVDSTALPEQTCDAIVLSAFGSAGQRCSALRLLCVQDDIADGLLAMLAGAMQELVVGPAAQAATDVGPVIDGAARAHLQRHIERLESGARLLARTPLPAGLPPGDWIAPCAFEIGSIAELREEIFGPVLHVLRFGPGTSAPTLEAVFEQIHALGYGLTLGLHTRIDARAARLAAHARVGNVYVNRGMTGAVMGVQPFGGEGLSGTGPKAGGPHYLLRFVVEQTLTVNTAAAGGNADLIAGL